MAELNLPALQEDILLIYNEEYYSPLRLDEMPDYLRCMLFSMAVNIGVKNAAMMLQGVINQETVKGGHSIKTDGNIGPITVQSANNFLVYNLELIRLRVKHRLFYNWQSYYNTLVTNNAIAWRDAALNNTFRPQTLRAVNLQGWFNRAFKYIEVEK
jgi:lysozyme family protein